MTIQSQKIMLNPYLAEIAQLHPFLCHLPYLTYWSSGHLHRHCLHLLLFQSLKFEILLSQYVSLKICWTKVHFVGPLVPLFRTLEDSAHEFKVRVDSSSPVLFSCLHAMTPRVIFGCRDWTSNLDRSPVRRAQYHCANSARLIKSIGITLLKYYLLCKYFTGS